MILPADRVKAVQPHFYDVELRAYLVRAVRKIHADNVQTSYIFQSSTILLFESCSIPWRSILIFSAEFVLGPTVMFVNRTHRYNSSAVELAHQLCK